MDDVLKILTNELGASAILSREDVATRAVSFWDNRPMQAKALIRPNSTKDVSKALKICHAHNQTIVTQGGNTTCVQGTNTNPDNIILSLEKMNKIVEIDSVSGTATLEAGAILESVQHAVNEENLFLPLDLGARGSCTIGGNLATNAGGMNVLRYGMARAMVLGLEAVLADGTIISSMDKMLKNNAGYDLKQLFIGTEGTLGVITRTIVRLMPKQVTKNTALVALPDFESVARLLNHFKNTIGTNLSAYEVMWGNYYKAITGPGCHRAPLARTHPYYVIIECDGSDVTRDDDRFMEVIEAAFSKGLILDAVLPKSEADRQDIWTVREDFEPLMHTGPLYMYDISLPILGMDDYVKTVEQRLSKSLPSSKFYVFGHVGDGNLHITVLPSSEDKNAKELSDKAIYTPLKSYHGSISAEHGIGFEKKPWLEQSRSKDEIALMKLMKKTLDPQCILNPGVVID